MKFRYAITYGQPRSDTLNQEELMKTFNEHVEEAEKSGLKVVFWGSPWGVSEGFVIIYDFGDKIENYEKFMASSVPPFTEGRTNLVLEW